MHICMHIASILLVFLFGPASVPCTPRGKAQAAGASAVLPNDYPQLKGHLFDLQHCLMTTRQSNGETLLLVAQGGGGL